MVSEQVQQAKSSMTSGTTSSGSTSSSSTSSSNSSSSSGSENQSKAANVQAEQQGVAKEEVNGNAMQTESTTGSGGSSESGKSQAASTTTPTSASTSSSSSTSPVSQEDNASEEVEQMEQKVDVTSVKAEDIARTDVEQVQQQPDIKQSSSQEQSSSESSESSSGESTEDSTEKTVQETPTSQAHEGTEQQQQQQPQRVESEKSASKSSQGSGSTSSSSSSSSSSSTSSGSNESGPTAMEIEEEQNATPTNPAPTSTTPMPDHTNQAPQSNEVIKQEDQQENKTQSTSSGSSSSSSSSSSGTSSDESQEQISQTEENRNQQEQPNGVPKMETQEKEKEESSESSDSSSSASSGSETSGASGSKEQVVEDQVQQENREVDVQVQDQLEKRQEASNGRAGTSGNLQLQENSPQDVENDESVGRKRKYTEYGERQNVLCVKGFDTRMPYCQILMGIEHAFKECGYIKGIHIPKTSRFYSDKSNKLYVDFDSTESRDRAVAHVQGKLIMGQNLEVYIPVKHEKRLKSTHGENGSQYNNYGLQNTHSNPSSSPKILNLVEIDIPYQNINRQEINHLFGQFGAISSITFSSSNNNTQIYFDSIQAAQRAVAELDGKQFQGKQIAVKYGQGQHAQQRARAFSSQQGVSNTLQQRREGPGTYKQSVPQNVQQQDISGGGSMYTTPQVFVHGFDVNGEEWDIQARLEDAFRLCGKIVSTKIVKKNNVIQNYAFIAFDSVQARNQALSMHGTYLGGRKLSVRPGNKQLPSTTRKDDNRGALIPQHQGTSSDPKAQLVQKIQESWNQRISSGK